jgi:hypothetical protein
MPGPYPRELHSKLALAIASGESVADWAKANGIVPRTAYDWARDPKLKRRVAAIRRKMLDQAIGLLAGGVANAAVILRQLSVEGDSESIKLSASRAILSDFMTVQSYAELDRRMAAIERRLEAKPDDQQPDKTPGKS